MIYLLSLWCFAELTDQILPSLVCKKTPGSVHVQQAAPQRDGGEQGGLQELRREKADRHLVDGQRLGGPQRHGPPLLPLRLPEPLRHRPEGGHPRRRLRPLLCCPFHGARPGLRLRGTRRPGGGGGSSGHAAAAPSPHGNAAVGRSVFTAIAVSVLSVAAAGLKLI